VRRLTILLAALGALLLVPAAQAFAHPTVKVNVEGGGQVSSVGGEHFLWEGKDLYEGEPAIECHNPSQGGDVCETELEEVESWEPELAEIVLHEIPAAGYKFAGWLNESDPGIEETGCKGHGEACYVYSGGSVSGTAEVTAIFECETEGGCEEGPSGPTNRVPLTVTKEAGGPGPVGTVSSKPKGINCATACNEAVASMFKGTPVVLKEKPASGDTFSHWTGACSGSAETCTVAMNEAEAVGAVFSGTSKAIANPKALTVSKGESSGAGTVKAAGLACEAECTQAIVLFQGPTGVAPKNKPGKTVTLKETPAYGSSFSGWTGCESNPSPSECVVVMEAAKEVKAEFSAKANVALTLNKAGSGTGTISSKPKAINCAATCTTQGASLPSGEAIVLKEKPATGMTFAGWSGGGCSGTAETCTVSPSSATTVTATFTGSPKPIANPQELTLTKAGSGYGTIKAAGLSCEALCTQAVSLFQGPTGIAPKNKPGKTVVLKATSAPGSKAVQWTGCESNPTPGECVVVMEESKGVTATFDELE
jgi:hypothetical protein